jgi:hypothetical protein
VVFSVRRCVWPDARERRRLSSLRQRFVHWGGRVTTPTAAPVRGPVGDSIRLWRHIFGDRQDLLQVFTGYRATPDKEARLGMPAEGYYGPRELEKAVAWAIHQSSINRDVYFCAHQLFAAKRVKANAAAVLCLWADVDHANLAGSPIKPSAVVESSPGHFHAYARLSRPIAPLKAEELNKRWARSFGADGSGFDLTQLLRVPGTRNYACEGTPEVRLFEIDEETVYDPDELDRILPQLPQLEERVSDVWRNTERGRRRVARASF